MRPATSRARRRLSRRPRRKNRAIRPRSAASRAATSRRATSTAPARRSPFAAAEAALSLAEKAGDLGDTAELQARIDANPKDHQARFDLALALNARGDKEGAIDQLLISVEYDRNWNEQAARKQLVEFFDAYGPKHEATLSGRRRLSSILFS
jgi:putative thioredoxin